MDTILHDKYSKKMNRRIGFFTQFLVNINNSEQSLPFNFYFLHFNNPIKINFNERSDYDV